MNRILTILLCSCCSVTFAQIDVTEFSQNVALQNFNKIELTEEEQRVASYQMITETYQIPSFDLYDQYWDVEHLRSRILDIPFSNDRLMLLLVQAANNPFEVPCSFNEITAKFGFTKKGDFHPGIDLLVEPQTLVKSCFDGVVRMSCHYGDYGLMVVIRHYNGLETVYAHLDKVCVKPGQVVNAGNIIGQAGKSGNANDYMLHFETRFMNEYFDPELIIDFDNETLIKNSLVLTPEDFKVTALDVLAKGGVAVPKPQSPVKPATVEKSPAATTVSNPAETLSDNSSEPVYHVVQKGETLYRIALNYKTTTEKIMKLNNIQNADMIGEGKRLRVK